MAKQAWIRIISEDEAEGALARLYEKWMDREHGVVDNIFKIHSLHPRTLDEHGELYKTIMHRPGGLTRAEREMIAVVVSAINDCHY